MSTDGTLALSDLVHRIAEAVIAYATPGDPWRVSPWPYDAFPGGTGETAEHHAFAVWPTSTALQPQRRSGAQVVRTRIGIRWIHKLNADNAMSDALAALDAESSLIAAVLGAPPDPNLAIALAEITTRATTADGTLFLGEVAFDLLHLYQTS